ncbi:mechanosensitive ion channel [Enhygromyxa salina]|uniref:Mechanosensitive ion channel n=1 Tax=Enhygromyxa salina TaxID=215803 RepID=A0A2S9XPS4_9BACT|nr:mechanosensitive ion channel [Enhygromyxa salina]PRP94863.1 hypothetical protein ENSA7_76860 [Enhygromyxa salina]
MLHRLERIIMGAVALLAVAVPRLALAGPPDAERVVVEQGRPDILTAQWWRDLVGPVASDDILQVGWQLLAGVLLFIVGWLIAKLLAWVVYRVLVKTSWDNRLAKRLGINMMVDDTEGIRTGTQADPHRLERITAKVVFYLLMALVVVGVLEFAGLEQAAAPIQGFVSTVAQALPLIGKAILIMVAAYIVALISSKVVVKALQIARVDKRFAELDQVPAAEVVVRPSTAAAGEIEAKDTRFSETAGRVVFWLVILLGLAGAIDALQIPAISRPLSNVVNSIMSLLPALGVAALIGIGGWILAKVVRLVVTRALEAVGFDTLVAKLRLSGLFGKSTPSKVAGWLAMAFILIETGIAALQAVGLETLSVPLTAMMAQFWLMLPSLLLAIVIVVVGVFVGRLARGITQRALEGVGLDRWMAKIGLNQIAEREDELGKPSGLAGFVVQIVIVLLALAQALHSLSLDLWASYVDALLVFSVTRAAVALVIVGVGFAVGNYVRDLIETRQRRAAPPPTAQPGQMGQMGQPGQTGPVGPGSAEQGPVWMAEFARYAVLVFAFTMAVHQLGFADEFVLLSFALLFGGLCLAGALAFGLGSRDVAGEIVRKQYREAKGGGAGSSSTIISSSHDV